MTADAYANSADAELDALVRSVMHSHERTRIRRHPTAEDGDNDEGADNVVYPGEWPRWSVGRHARHSQPDEHAEATAFLTFVSLWLRSRADAGVLVKELARRVESDLEEPVTAEAPPPAGPAPESAATPRTEAASEVDAPDGAAADPLPERPDQPAGPAGDDHGD